MEKKKIFGNVHVQVHRFSIWLMIYTLSLALGKFGLV